MIKQILSFSFIFFYTISFAQTSKPILQKPPITPDVFGKFASVNGINISNDGNYVIYTIVDPFAGTTITNIKALHSNWEYSIGAYGGQFTDDSKYVIYKNKNDSLCLFSLEKKTY